MSFGTWGFKSPFAHNHWQSLIQDHRPSGGLSANPIIALTPQPARLEFARRTHGSLWRMRHAFLALVVAFGASGRRRARPAVDGAPGVNGDRGPRGQERVAADADDRPRQLDVGPYPTTPRQPLGVAGDPGWASSSRRSGWPTTSSDRGRSTRRSPLVRLRRAGARERRSHDADRAGRSMRRSSSSTTSSTGSHRRAPWRTRSR